MTSRWLCLSLVITAACFDGAHRPATACEADTCDPPAPACSGNKIRTYRASCDDGTCSYASTDTDCGAAGCCSDHCCAVEPSNSDVFGRLASTGLVVSPPNGTFDTGSQCTESSLLGACTVVARAGLPDACVCRTDELAIGDLRIVGARALVLLASRKVTIYAKLDLSANQSVLGGPGASATQYPVNAPPRLGGEGGSFGSVGGGASPAPVYGNDSLIPLVGGTRGRHGGTLGGGGGGALQITAGERIDVAGVIDAGGGGGDGGASSAAVCGAGGGGSGGAILLEAPVVNVSGLVIANGGGGGGGGGNLGFGNNGEDTAGDAPANGGVGAKNNFCSANPVPGGDGGRGAFDVTPAAAGGPSAPDNSCGSFGGGGGGGGGFGRVRINTTSQCNCTGRVMPRPSTGLLVRS